MNLTRIGVIADDLTGGASIAGELVREGWPCGIRSSVHELPVDGSVVLDTGSRFAKPPQAVEAVKAAEEALRRSGISLTMKKIDSSLKGNALVETVAYLQSQRSRVIITPACPVAGVGVDGGVVRRGSEPGMDVLSTLREFTTVDLLPLEVVRSGSSAVEEWLGQHAATHVVADSLTQDDLDAVCAGARRAGISSFVGTYGMGAALARASDDPRPVLRSPGTDGTRVIFIVGSASDEAREQVQVVAKAGALEIELDVHALLQGDSDAECGRVARAIRQSRADVVIHTATATTRADVDRLRSEVGLSERELAERFALPMVAAVEAALGAALVLVGGETTGAVTSLLGIDSYEVVAELQPAAPLCLSNSARWPIVVTKPGSFGDADTLASLGRALRS